MEQSHFDNKNTIYRKPKDNLYGFANPLGEGHPCQIIANRRKVIQINEPHNKLVIHIFDIAAK